ncbi:hypothetical protein BC940DRAFT_332685 [Gongronella butleri]|nr:hypothetical protein BC940DRAFT_332685 [Gongronella butleri]
MDSASIPALLRHVYPLLARDPTIAHFKTRAIIAPLHVDVDAINDSAIAAFPGKARVMKSYDSVYGEQEHDVANVIKMEDVELDDDHQAAPQVRSFASPPSVYMISRIKFIISMEGE